MIREGSSKILQATHRRGTTSENVIIRWGNLAMQIYIPSFLSFEAEQVFCCKVRYSKNVEVYGDYKDYRYPLIT